MEAKVASEPHALVMFVKGLGLPGTRIGLEARPLHAGLTQAGLEAVLLETRQRQSRALRTVVKAGHGGRRASVTSVGSCSAPKRIIRG